MRTVLVKNLMFIMAFYQRFAFYKDSDKYQNANIRIFLCFFETMTNYLTNIMIVSLLPILINIYQSVSF